MSQIVFQVISGGERDGKEIKTNGAAIRPGYLVKLDTSGSTVSLNTINNAPYGFAYGGRHSVYGPTTQVFATDEPLTVVWGVGEALLSSDFFTGGSLPAVGDKLYPQASGLLGSQGANKVGDVLGIRAVTEANSGTGASLNVVHIRFNIQP